MKNFMSYANERFELGESGLVLLEGKNLDEGDSNGSGKSSVWDAISWCLFGQTVRGLKNDEVVHRKFGKDCCVQVEVVGSSGALVSRYRAHDTYGNRLFVEVDGKTVELGTVAQTQDWLLKFLEIDFDLFRCTVLFAQGETFNFVDAGNKQQKEILSKVMRVSFDGHLDKARGELRKIETEREDIVRKIDVLKSHVVEDPGSIFRTEYRDWGVERDAKIERMASDIVDFKSKIVVQQPVERIIEAKKKLSVRASETDGRLNEFSESVSKLNGEISFWTKELAVSQKLKDRCVTCRQPIVAGYASERVDSCRSEIAKSEGLLNDTRKESMAFETERLSIRERLEKVGGLIHDHRRIGEANERWAESAERLSKQIADLKVAVNPWEQKHRDALLRQKDIRSKLIELSKRSEAIELNRPYYTFWVQAFGDSGIKSFIFDLVCSTLTTKANQYLNILTAGSVTIAFDTQQKLKTGELREKFDCSVVSDGKRVDYASYSGGEKRRISLAVDMALAELASDYAKNKFNIVVFDEQDSYMDRAGRGVI